MSVFISASRKLTGLVRSDGHLLFSLFSSLLCEDLSAQAGHFRLREIPFVIFGTRFFGVSALLLSFDFPNRGLSSTESILQREECWVRAPSYPAPPAPEKYWVSLGDLE